MKKFLIFLLIVAVIGFGAYKVLEYIESMPALEDLDQTAQALEDAGCTVYHIKADDDDSLVDEGASEVLFAQGNDSDSNMALFIIVYESAELARINYKLYKNTIDYEKNEIELEIDLLTYEIDNFDLSPSEKEYYSENVKELEEKLEEAENVVVGIKGNILWYGTKEAVKASRP